MILAGAKLGATSKKSLEVLPPHALSLKLLHVLRRLSSAGCELAPRNKRSLILLARLLIPAQLCFGPIMSAIASGLVYGNDEPRLWAAGDCLLHASIWVRSVNRTSRVSVGSRVLAAHQRLGAL